MRFLWIAVGVALWFARCDTCDDSPAATVRIATFNIEDFPKHATQLEAAFDELARLDASIVGLQEITEPALFESLAKRRLGHHWQSVFVATLQPERSPIHHLGVVFDDRQWTFVSTTTHTDTQIEGRHKPVLEVRLRPRAGAVVRVLVVHLKAGGDGRAIRAQQYRGLSRILERVRRSGDRVILLGDFNATDDVSDREDLARLARSSRMTWATEPLACSAFWDRTRPRPGNLVDDDGCFRSRLDHVLASIQPVAVEVAGACATHGCEREDSCPTYVEQVSDHCPVVIELSSR